MNALSRLRIRLGDRIDSAALGLTDGDRRQAAVCALHHRIPAGTWTALAGAAAATLASSRRTATGPLAILAAAAGLAQTVLDRAHSTAVAYPGHLCQRCPQPEEDDGRGDGGVWLDADWDDIPPAPAPMPPLAEDRIRAMTGDLDAELAALHDTRKDASR